MAHIRATLPDIKARISQQLQKFNAELQTLGGAFGDTSMLPPPRSPCSVRNSVASSRSSRSTRPSFMRLGNHSTPHLTPSSMLDEPSEVLLDADDATMHVGP